MTALVFKNEGWFEQLRVLVYSFARVTAAVSMRVADYYTQGYVDV